MAHVEVVRRSMRPEEWTALRYSWLKRGVIEDREEILTWRIQDARQTAEQTYEYNDGPERDLRRGDLYFTPDGTAFIRAEADIPVETCESMEKLGRRCRIAVPCAAAAEKKGE